MLSGLLSQTEFFDGLMVSLPVTLFQVSKKLPSRIDKLQEAPSGMIVLLVLLEVLGELSDTLG